MSQKKDISKGGIKMSNEEREAWLKEISLIKEAREILQKDNEEYLVNKYIEENQEEIYNKYCETFPERITSDFEYEDIPDEWIIDYAKDRI